MFELIPVPSGQPPVSHTQVLIPISISLCPVHCLHHRGEIIETSGHWGPGRQVQVCNF